MADSSFFFLLFDVKGVRGHQQAGVNECFTHWPEYFLEFLDTVGIIEIVQQFAGC